jgi:hypothetical protein
MVAMHRALRESFGVAIRGGLPHRACAPQCNETQRIEAVRKYEGECPAVFVVSRRLNACIRGCRDVSQ